MGALEQAAAASLSYALPKLHAECEMCEFLLLPPLITGSGQIQVPLSSIPEGLIHPSIFPAPLIDSPMQITLLAVAHEGCKVLCVL